MTGDELFRLCLETLRAGQIARAEALGRDMARISPDDPRGWHLLGIILAQRDHFPEAATCFTRSLRIAPRQTPVLYDQAVAQYRMGRRRDAVASLDEAVVLTPDHAEAWNLRGRILLELSAFESALASFDRVLRGQPGQPDALANRGDGLRLLGRAADAGAAYRQALERQPSHARALNGLGLLAAEAGQWPDALRQHDRAIAASPHLAEAHNGRGVALAGLGEHAAGLASLARALALRPRYLDALVNTGNTLRRMGRLEDALNSHDQAVQCDPDAADAHYSRAGVLLDLERPGEALDACDRALSLHPGFPPALMRRGNILLRLRRLQEALETFDQALALSGAPPPYRAEAHYLRATSLRQLERMDEAITGYDQAIASRPDFVEAWSHRGAALRDMNELPDALYSYEQALRINPRHIETLNARCVLLAMLDRNEEAEASVRLVLSLDPNNGAAYNNLGNSLRRLGRVSEALEAFESAMCLAPDPERVRLNYGMCLLQAGEFTRGWREYEARWETDARPISLEGVRAQLWRGEEDIAGKIIVLYSEQGLGDSIQFSRYVPMVAQRGAKVLLGAPAVLRPLYQCFGGSVELIDRHQVTRPFDLHCPLMSLPLAFRTEIETIPNHVPYLAPPGESRRHWRDRLGPRRDLRVGLAWSGSSGHKEDSGRSIPLEQFGPIIAAAPEAYCLQRDLRPLDIPALAMHRRIGFFGHELRDFADTAALAAEMDLVISVDTSVLHLAGALGRPVWGLIPFAADWRWLYNREDSPWYPTMRLFRQRSIGDWGEVVQRVRDALETFRRGFDPNRAPADFPDAHGPSSDMTDDNQPFCRTRGLPIGGS
jgi:tetratricopeptide (TPR) repeat protein